MDAIFAILNNPIVLLAVGIVVKYVPGVRAVIANWMIPFINILLAWLAQLLGPAEAHAFGGPFVLTIGFFGFTGWLAGLGAALWQAAQAFILHAMFRHVMPAKSVDSK